MNIRQMTMSDLDFASSCTLAEGWGSEGKDVFEDFHAFFPEGCLMSEEDGNPTGIGVATKYLRHGFIGELIVLQEKRGTGIGTALFLRAVEVIKKRGVRSILLDGDLKAVPLYEREGFRKVCRSLRFAGKLRNVASAGVRTMTARDLEAIIEIDSELFGDDRSFFLKRRMAGHPQYCLVQEQDGEIAGYVFGRKGRGLIAVGPWAVLGGEQPCSLLGALSSRAGDLPLRIGVLESNSAAAGFIRSLDGFSEEEFSWRMEWGTPSELGDHPSLFGIGSAASG